MERRRGVQTMVVRAVANLEYAAGRFLACPQCHARVEGGRETLRCTNDSCARSLRISDDVVLAEGHRDASFFDETHELMSITTQQSGTRRMCYSQQTSWLGSRLDTLPSTEQVIVDLGCGPRLPYHRSDRYFLVGVDASFEAVRLNDEVDLRIFGSATHLPFGDKSVDVIVCFYLLHHLVGRHVSEHYANLRAAFMEFGRVLKPGGLILAFEVSPGPLFFSIQRAAWGSMRRVYPKLDMFFWSTRALREVSLASLPAHTALRQQEFHCPFWVTFPFVFAWPNFRLPRGLFPFRAYGFEWRLPLAGP